MLVLKTGITETLVSSSRPSTGSGSCLEALPPIDADYDIVTIIIIVLINIVFRYITHNLIVNYIVH